MCSLSLSLNTHGSPWCRFPVVVDIAQVNMPDSSYVAPRTGTPLHLSVILTRARPCTLPLPAFACLCSPPARCPSAGTPGRWPTPSSTRTTRSTSCASPRRRGSLPTRSTSPSGRVRRQRADASIRAEKPLCSLWFRGSVGGCTCHRLGPHVRSHPSAGRVQIFCPLRATPHLIDPMDMLLTSPRLSGVIF